MTDGGPKRAATILLGSSAEMTLSAKTPVRVAAGLADGFFEGDFGPVTAFGMEIFSTKWAMISGIGFRW